jgi:hypothetical protein
MDYGATIAAAFASPDEEEIKSIRTACATCIRSSKSGRSSISARMRAYARTAPPVADSIPTNHGNTFGTNDGSWNNNYSHLSTSSRGKKSVVFYHMSPFWSIFYCIRLIYIIFPHFPLAPAHVEGYR